MMPVLGRSTGGGLQQQQVRATSRRAPGASWHGGAPGLRILPSASVLSLVIRPSAGIGRFIPPPQAKAGTTSLGVSGARHAPPPPPPPQSPLGPWRLAAVALVAGSRLQAAPLAPTERAVVTEAVALALSQGAAKRAPATLPRPLWRAARNGAAGSPPRGRTSRAASPAPAQPVAAIAAPRAPAPAAPGAASFPVMNLGTAGGASAGEERSSDGGWTAVVEACRGGSSAGGTIQEFASRGPSAAGSHCSSRRASSPGRHRLAHASGAGDVAAAACARAGAADLLKQHLQEIDKAERVCSRPACVAQAAWWGDQQWGSIHIPAKGNKTARDGGPPSQSQGGDRGAST
jgi:hypothetical protein